MFIKCKIIILIVLIFKLHVTIAVALLLFVIELHQKYHSEHGEKSNYDEEAEFLRIKSSTGILLGWQF